MGGGGGGEGRGGGYSIYEVLSKGSRGGGLHKYFGAGDPLRNNNLATSHIGNVNMKLLILYIRFIDRASEFSPALNQNVQPP